MQANGCSSKVCVGVYGGCFCLSRDISIEKSGSAIRYMDRRRSFWHHRLSFWATCPSERHFEALFGQTSPARLFFRCVMLRCNRPKSIEGPHRSDRHERGSARRHPGWMGQPAYLRRVCRQAGHKFWAAVYRGEDLRLFAVLRLER